MPTPRVCSFPGCGLRHLARGLCGSHHGQFRRGVELRPLHQGPRKRIRPVEPHPDLPGVSIVAMAGGVTALISSQDAAEVGRFNWTSVPREHTTYAGRQIRHDDGTGSTDFLHRFVGRLMGLSMELLTDHENGNGLDCRRDNLRAATRSQNSMNTRIRSDNTSGIKGVHWDKREERWKAYIGANGTQYNLGYFDSIDAARAAVASARAELHGDFANQGAG